MAMVEHELALLDYDIEITQEQVDSLLRAPYELRVTDPQRWHQALLKRVERLADLRDRRARLLADLEHEALGGWA